MCAQVYLGLPRPDSSVVERGPEKAGVGGSIPSLATTSALTDPAHGRGPETRLEMRDFLTGKETCTCPRLLLSASAQLLQDAFQRVELLPCFAQLAG
jgi:hypothetical protein